MAAKKMKWALCTTWRQSQEFATKTEATDALVAWKDEKEAAGWLVGGSKTKGIFTARAPGADYQQALTAAERGQRPNGVATAIVMKIGEVKRASD